MARKATAPNGTVHTKNGKTDWTHAVIKEYDNGFQYAHWAKSQEAAQKLYDSIQSAGNLQGVWLVATEQA